MGMCVCVLALMMHLLCTPILIPHCKVAARTNSNPCVVCCMACVCAWCVWNIMDEGGSAGVNSIVAANVCTCVSWPPACQSIRCCCFCPKPYNIAPVEGAAYKGRLSCHPITNKTLLAGLRARAHRHCEPPTDRPGAEPPCCTNQCHAALCTNPHGDPTIAHTRIRILEQH